MSEKFKLVRKYVLPKKWKYKALITIVFAFILTVGIEFLQYRFCLGCAETDDIIFNALVCVIGTLSFGFNRSSNKEMSLNRNGERSKQWGKLI